MSFAGWFGLRRRRTALVEGFRAMEQYDRIQNAIFADLGLHYVRSIPLRARASSMGECMTRVANMGTLFGRGALWGSSCLGNLKPSDEKPSL